MEQHSFSLHLVFAVLVFVLWLISGTKLATKFPGYQMFYLGWAVIALDYLISGVILVTGSGVK